MAGIRIKAAGIDLGIKSLADFKLPNETDWHHIQVYRALVSFKICKKIRKRN